MKIVIVGDGKIGSTLAEQLSREGHEITIIDRGLTYDTEKYVTEITIPVAPVSG